MSVTLWIDTPSEETIELGGTLQFWAAVSEMANTAGDAWLTEYAALAGVQDQCERQEDADPEWLADVRAQAATMLKAYPDIGENARSVLEALTRT